MQWLNFYSEGRITIINFCGRHPSTTVNGYQSTEIVKVFRFQRKNLKWSLGSYLGFPLQQTNLILIVMFLYLIVVVVFFLSLLHVLFSPFFVDRIFKDGRIDFPEIFRGNRKMIISRGVFSSLFRNSSLVPRFLSCDKKSLLPRDLRNN